MNRKTTFDDVSEYLDFIKNNQVSNDIRDGLRRLSLHEKLMLINQLAQLFRLELITSEITLNNYQNSDEYQNDEYWSGFLHGVNHMNDTLRKVLEKTRKDIKKSYNSPRMYDWDYLDVKFQDEIDWKKYFEINE